MKKDPFMIMEGDVKLRLESRFSIRLIWTLIEGRRGLMTCQEIDTNLSDLQPKIASPEWFEQAIDKSNMV